MRNYHSLEKKQSEENQALINSTSGLTDIKKSLPKDITSNKFIEILLISRPAKNINQRQKNIHFVSVIGHRITSYLNPTSAASFASALPIEFHHTVKFSLILGVKAYNCIPRAHEAISWEAGYYDSCTTTPEEMKNEVALNCLFASASAIFTPVIGTYLCTFHSLTYCCCLMPLQLASRSNCARSEPTPNHLANDFKRYTEMMKGSLKLMFMVPCLKTTVKTTACLIAYTIGSGKDSCRNEFANRISIFDEPSTKPTVKSSLMTRL